MPADFKISSALKQSIGTAVLPMLLFFTCIFAETFDFDKLSTLARQRYGEDAYQDVIALQQLTSQLKTAPESEKLKRINDFFNQKITFADDIDVWAQTDYWATPLESIGRQAGDCEDFSIAKYMFLSSPVISLCPDINVICEGYFLIKKIIYSFEFF